MHFPWMATSDLLSPRNDPDPEMIPNPEMIRNSTPKWYRPWNDPRLSSRRPPNDPQLICTDQATRRHSFNGSRLHLF